MKKVGKAIDYTHPKYARGYRVHHVVALAIFVFVLFSSAYLFFESSQTKTILLGDKPETAVTESRLDFITSARGFSFNLPKLGYSVTATEDIAKPLQQVQRPYSAQYQVLELHPNLRQYTSTKLAYLRIKSQSDREYSQTFKKSGETEAIKSVAVKELPGVKVETKQPEEAELNGQKVWKVTSSTVPKDDTEAKVYFVSWVKVEQQTVYVVSVGNLLSQEDVYVAFPVPLRTIKIGQQTSVEKLSGRLWGGSQTKRSELSVDEVSPSVVKVYNFVCADVVLKGQVLLKNTCDGSTGSGFFINDQGAIATNGHVVTVSSVDLLIASINASPNGVQQVLRYLGYSEEAIASAKPGVLTLVLTAKLYDLPADVLSLQNKRELTVAAVGNQALAVANQAEISKLLDTFQETDQLKRAETIAVDYAPKDIVQVNQPSGVGFTAGDAAVLRIKQKSTPYLAFADNNQTDINNKILVIGFPTDAENQLTDNQTLSPTVTSGTISAKRIASGRGGVLYQSDADASQGNSGGPALREDGSVVGLLTYRYKDSTSANAAKSYIRDIQGVAALAKQNRVDLGGDNKTRDTWERALQDYKKERYSAALRGFAETQSRFAGHRLAYEYAFKSKQAIDEGKDKTDDGWKQIATILVMAMSLGGTVVAGYSVHRHRVGHHLHRQYHALRHD